MMYEEEEYEEEGEEGVEGEYEEGEWEEEEEEAAIANAWASFDASNEDAPTEWTGSTDAVVNGENEVDEEVGIFEDDQDDSRI